MPETDMATPPAVPQDAASAPTAPPDPVALLEQTKRDLEAKIEQAQLAARTTQGQVRSEIARLEKRLGHLNAALDEAATRGMTPEDAKVYLADKVLREHETQTDMQAEYDRVTREFQARADVRLQTFGIATNDPRLQESYRRYAAEATSPASWDIALDRAIRDVQEDEARKVVQERAQLEEEKRVLARNAERASQGPIDRGAPASGRGKRPAEMEPEEFKQHLQRLDAEYRRSHGR